MSNDVKSELAQRQELNCHFRELVGKFIFDEQFAADNWAKLQEDPEAVLTEVGLDLQGLDEADAQDILAAFKQLDWASIQKVADAFYYPEKAGT
jgi:hypothetical protein